MQAAFAELKAKSIKLKANASRLELRSSDQNTAVGANPRAEKNTK